MLIEKLVLDIANEKKVPVVAILEDATNYYNRSLFSILIY